MSFHDKPRLDSVLEAIDETDRLRKKLCLLRDELKGYEKSDAYFYSSSNNAAVKRARIDHYKLLRKLA